MKFWVAASITLAILADVALARNCQAGNHYCGYNLNYMGKPPQSTPPDVTIPSLHHLGNYQMEMQDACRRQGTQDCWGMRVNHVLFRCQPLLSGKGRIVLAEDCNEKEKGCQDGGKLASDYC
jgi:hypothetical protein